MDYFSKQKHIDTWGNVVRSSSIDNKHCKKVSIYLGELSKEIASDPTLSNKNQSLMMVANSLCIESLDSLDNVFFEDQPTFRDQNGNIKQTENIFQRINLSIGDDISLLNRIENGYEKDQILIKKIVDGFSYPFNKFLREGCKLHFYRVISNIQEIFDPIFGNRKIGIMSECYIKPPGISIEDL